MQDWGCTGRSVCPLLIASSWQTVHVSSESVRTILSLHLPRRSRTPLRNNSIGCFLFKHPQPSPAEYPAQHTQHLVASFSWDKPAGQGTGETNDALTGLSSWLELLIASIPALHCVLLFSIGYQCFELRSLPTPHPEFFHPQIFSISDLLLTCLFFASQCLLPCHNALLPNPPPVETSRPKIPNSIPGVQNETEPPTSLFHRPTCSSREHKIGPSLQNSLPEFTEDTWDSHTETHCIYLYNKCLYNFQPWQPEYTIEIFSSSFFTVVVHHSLSALGHYQKFGKGTFFFQFISIFTILKSWVAKIIYPELLVITYA